MLALFFVASSFYCGLAFVPFTWQQVIQSQLLPQLARFAQLQHWFYWGIIIPAVLLLWPAKGTPRRNLWLACFTLLGIFGLVLAVHPALSLVVNAQSSLWWAAAFLLPPLAVGMLDLATRLPKLRWSIRSPAGDRRLFRAACGSAFFVFSFFALEALPHAEALPRTAQWLWILLPHLVVFFVAFSLLVIAGALASFVTWPARAEFVLVELIFGAMLFELLLTRVFPAMSFSGLPAILYSALIAVVITAMFAGLSVTLQAPVSEPVQSGLDLATLPLVFPLGRKPWQGAVALLCLAAAGWVILRTVAGLDRNFLIQELTVVIVWLAAFAVFYRIAAGRQSMPRSVLPPLAMSLAVICFYAIFAPTAMTSGLQDYAGHNISFRLAAEMLAPRAADSTFYSFLSASSNIRHSVPVHPVDLEIAGHLTPSAGPKPHIFVIVIDSLRRDYVEPYNPAVTFTPSVAAFAKESTVIPNAFTHYGGTGLSEPSIWTGSMMLHKQYVTPFAPMNSLAKLIDAEGYHSYITMDTILDTVTPRRPSLTELDAGRANMSFDLCSSLSELESKLQTDQPVFAYTQPQNIHISVITREGKTVPAGESYPGFDAPYASRLHRIDACFGHFIGYLKEKNIYDSSIVVFTADHGDSLGEQGRFGRAYTIFPEVIRIPMIVHLPASMRGKYAWRSGHEPAFSTDITPSLYYLLGHRAIVNQSLFGRPLFTETAAEQKQYGRPDYLIASSYAAVYGLLSDEGRQLFISDTVNAHDYAYTLSPGLPVSERQPSAEESVPIQQKIRAAVTAINDTYNFHPAQ